MARSEQVVAGGTIPAFVNPAARSGKAALDALQRYRGFHVRLTSPLQLEGALQQAVRAGEPRVLVGSPVEAKPFGLDSALVQRFRLDLSRRRVKLAIDGEIRRTWTPLEYRLERAALRVVLPDRSG